MDLYFEMYSGISGNMTIAALLDLGADRKKFEQALQSMNFGIYKEKGKLYRCGIF